MFIRHLFLLASLIGLTVSYSFAEPTIIKEPFTESHYKVEKPVKEQSAERTVAGEKPSKEKRDVAGEAPVKDATESGVQYWKYSE